MRTTKQSHSSAKSFSATYGDRPAGRVRDPESVKGKSHPTGWSEQQRGRGKRSR